MGTQTYPSVADFNAAERGRQSSLAPLAPSTETPEPPVAAPRAAAPRPLPEVIEGVLREFKANYSYFAPPEDRLTDAAVAALTGRLTEALKAELTRVVHHRVQETERRLSQVQDELEIVTARIEDTDLDILSELRDVYNLVRVLVARLGGSVIVTRADLDAAIGTTFAVKEDGRDGNWTLTAS